jgi:hypothetical protein
MHCGSRPQLQFEGSHLRVGVLFWFAWLALLAISMSGLPAAQALIGGNASHGGDAHDV